MKMAAAEALWEHSGDPAPFTVFAAVNEAEKKNDFEVQIPYVLSFLSFNQFSGSLDGINDLQEQYEDKYGPGDYIPNVTLPFLGVSYYDRCWRSPVVTWFRRYVCNEERNVTEVKYLS